jgi:hypothetical protein
MLDVDERAVVQDFDGTDAPADARLVLNPLDLVAVDAVAVLERRLLVPRPGFYADAFELAA